MDKPPVAATQPVRRPKAAAPSTVVPYLQVLSGSAAGQIVRLGEFAVVVLGRDNSCDLLLDDPGVSRQHAKITRNSDTQQYLLEDLGSTNGTFIGDEEITQQILKDGDRIVLGEAATVKFGLSTLEEVDLAMRHFEGATRDALTLTLNRRAWFERAEQEIAICRRTQGVFSLVLLDVDHFKKVNDTFGHPAGDAVLRQLADALRQQIRLEDVLGRYGGEEFVLLLRGIEPPGAFEAAERLRKAVAAANMLIPVGEEDREHQVTISLGVGAWKMAESLSELLARVDAALYKAKEGGRNQVARAE